MFFVRTGLPTGVNETKSAAFCRNSRLKSKFDIRSYTYMTNTRKYTGLLYHDYYIFSKSVLKRDMASRKSVLYMENSYDVACLKFGLITLGPNSLKSTDYGCPKLHNFKYFV